LSEQLSHSALRKLTSQTVLTVDLKMTDLELSQVIQSRCSEFGLVNSVKIHRDPTPFAMVEMGSHYQALELAGQYGGSMFGTSVLVHLEPASR
jgi:hypothetical protein